jgi:hypothetical protein
MGERKTHERILSLFISTEDTSRFSWFFHATILLTKIIALENKIVYYEKIRNGYFILFIFIWFKVFLIQQLATNQF